MACPPRTSTLTAAALALVVAGGACDGEQRQRDAAAPTGLQTAHVAIRLDAPSGTDPSVSVLAFKAEMTGIEAREVLAAVDPLMATPPVTGCVLQEVDDMANRLRARAGWVELQVLGDVQVDLGLGDSTLRPAPGVYPDLATVVAGVVGETGPMDLSELPSKLTVRLGDETSLDVPVPPLGWAQTLDGNVIDTGTELSVRGDLDLHVQGSQGTFIEIRPFGATRWGACALAPLAGNDAGRVIVPAAILQKLARLSGDVPVSFDVVWRSIATTGTPSTSGLPTRVSLETRSSALVRLIP